MKTLSKLLTATFLISVVSVTATAVDHVVEVKKNSVIDSAGKQSHITTHSSKKVMKLAIKLVQLEDNQGLKYIGGIVNATDLQPYLVEMSKLLAKDFPDYRENQTRRDHGEFHMTLINPYEYKEVNQNEIELGKVIDIDLLGLGRVTKGAQQTYFVVVNSKVAQQQRNQLGLSVKDFHVTLGFKPNDIYGVSKGAESLIREK